MAQDSDRLDEIRDAVWLFVKLLARDGHDPGAVVLVLRAMADTIERLEARIASFTSRDVIGRGDPPSTPKPETE